MEGRTAGFRKYFFFLYLKFWQKVLTLQKVTAYGIVYSKYFIPAGSGILWRDLKGRRNKTKAITLKPLDIGTIVLETKITQSRITEGKLFYDGSMLHLDMVLKKAKKWKKHSTIFHAKSNLYPYIIRSARLNVGLEKFTSSDYSVKSLGTEQFFSFHGQYVSPERRGTGFSVIFNLGDHT